MRNREKISFLMRSVLQTRNQILILRRNKQGAERERNIIWVNLTYVFLILQFNQLLRVLRSIRQKIESHTQRQNE